jgi:sulfate adenylyltransferase subunit 2
MTATDTVPHLSQLRALEAEAVHIMREVAAQLERPVLLFSGGKDSIVLLRLAEKAFRPGAFPFPVMHVDTGHNFPEVLEFRDRRIRELGERLIVASVQESIDTGRVQEETGPAASRNRLQTTTLLDAIAAHDFDAAFGGARRDEERARAKERRSASRSRASTSPTSARCSSATGCCWRSPSGSSRARTSRSGRSPCATAPSAT